MVLLKKVIDLFKEVITDTERQIVQIAFPEETAVKVRGERKSCPYILWMITGMAILVIKCLKKEYPQPVLIKGAPFSLTSSSLLFIPIPVPSDKLGIVVEPSFL